MAELQTIDMHKNNGLLCDFWTRWRISGDYIRCGWCDRPQLTSYADNDFPHADFCPVKDKPTMERHPWRTYAALLAPLMERRAPEPAGREDDTEVVIARLYAAARHVDLARQKLPDAFNHQEANDIIDAINLLRRLSHRAGDVVAWIDPKDIASVRACAVTSHAARKVMVSAAPTSKRSVPLYAPSAPVAGSGEENGNG